MAKPYLAHLNRAIDLRTTPAATRAGFVKLALEKNRRATPHVAQARILMVTASTLQKPADLLNIPSIRPALLTAAGVSDKATNHLDEADRANAVRGLIEQYLIPAGDKFAEELTYRFLLTRGDTLGGSMRNAAGFMAQCLLSSSLVAAFRVSGKPFRWYDKEAKAWQGMPESDAGIELRMGGLAWETATQQRTLTYNTTCPLVKNNIDLCVFSCSPENYSAAVLRNGGAYIALGELKGGIDPAGADEHWKTARTALSRISAAFGKQGLTPHTFFIGAAIEAKMAEEIWEMLEANTLENAANLTDDKQRVSFVKWLCEL